MGREVHRSYSRTGSLTVIFEETKLKGAFLIETESIEDERGFFVRTFCSREFGEHSIRFRVVQCNTSYNRLKGTLRGLHYQASPHEEAKLVRCVAGSAFDVIVDLRPGSPTLGKWCSAQLSAANRRMLFVPEGFAHGFQTLENDTELFYLMSEPYHPESAQEIRWDDPRIAIEWPMPAAVTSDRDRNARYLDSNL